MPLTASALAMSLVFSTGAAVPATLPGDDPLHDTAVHVVTAERLVLPVSRIERHPLATRPAGRAARPAGLMPLYSAFGVMQGLDAWSTRRAIDSGAREANPVVREVAGSTPGMLAAKALSTAGSIYFTEKLWKKSRKGSIALMAALNGATAVIVARNMANAR